MWFKRKRVAAREGPEFWSSAVNYPTKSGFFLGRKNDLGARDLTDVRTGVDGSVDRFGWPRDVVDRAADPLPIFHRFERLGQGAIRDGSELPFDIIKMVGSLQCRQNRKRPRAAQQVVICLG